ncbi:MAG TPA: ATP-binding protein [Rhizomicrobium sp.]
MTLENEELELLFSDMESDRVERKESAANDDRIREAICAFANDLPNHQRPGVIFVGQRNDGSCANFPIDDRLLLRLGGWRSDGKILPFPVMRVDRKTISGCIVAAIIVEPTDNPPTKIDGRIWIRVGPRRGIATAEEERRLLEKRRWGNLSFDAQGVIGSSLADLDMDYFEKVYLPAAIPAEILQENGRSREQQLQALRLVQQNNIPTTTAILLLGKNPRAWIPGAYIQFLRIEGTELINPIKNQRLIDGPIADQIKSLDELIDLNVERGTTVGGVVRQDSEDYPPVALRQLVRNAVLHRSYEGTNAPIRITWYSDRVEIQSPGGPYGQVTKANFGQTGVTDYRNPTIAEALRNLSYVERFGVGIAIARDALAKNGNPPPEFVIEDQHVHVTVRRKT